MVKTAAGSAGEAVVGLLVMLNSLLPAVLVLRCRRLRELLMYQLVASVSLGETLTGAVSVLLGCLTLFDVPISSWECAIGIHLRFSLAGSTAVGIFCIGLERYVTVIHGLRYYDILTDARRRLLLAASWVFVGVCFCAGIATHLSQARDIDVQGDKCLHFDVLMPAFNICVELFTSTLYLANGGINIAVGIVSIKQMRNIRRMEANVGRIRQLTPFQHSGFIAIAFVSLMYCVFIFPNFVRTIYRSLGLNVQKTTNDIIGFMRLLALIADGWCLTLLCPMLKEELIKMLCPSKRRQRAQLTHPGNHRQISANENLYEDNARIALTTADAKSNENIETRRGESTLTSGVALASPPTSGMPGKRNSSRAPPDTVCGGREVLVAPLDLHQSITTSAARTTPVSRSISSAPSVRLAWAERPGRLRWSRHSLTLYRASDCI